MTTGVFQKRKTTCVFMREKKRQREIIKRWLRDGVVSISMPYLPLSFLGCRGNTIELVMGPCIFLTNEFNPLGKEVSSGTSWEM